ncbi:MAG: M20/M25/M40 family metallo-hydrolase, partial [Bacteroidales bacterium]|nr:M20/M25/M40 family metallo-hydrolase [Bacteroidales bacterium]
MKTLIADSIALLRRMVATPSPSFEEEAVCQLIQEQLEAWGIACTRIGRNIVARNRHYDAALPTLALDAHIDTVPPAESYTRDPYDPGDDPDIVYGLGSNDDGGSVVAMIAAFRHFYAMHLPINLVLTLSCEEERSGPDGAAKLYGPDFDAEWVLVGEPTGMRAATSERGLLVIDAEAKGVSGHAARDEGVNALYIALEDIARLRAYRFRKVSPVMGSVRLNVTQIAAGSAHNVIPDNCRFVIDVRPTEQYANEEILEALQAICTSRLHARNLRNRSSATRPNSPLTVTLAKLGIPTFSSPTTSNWMRVGRDAIKMGPGDS